MINVNEKFNKYRNDVYEPEINDDNKDSIPRLFSLRSPRIVERAKKENEKYLSRESKELIKEDEKDKKQDSLSLTTKTKFPQFSILLLAGFLLTILSVWSITRVFAKQSHKKRKSGSSAKSKKTTN